MKDKELNMKIPEQPRLCCSQCALGRVLFQGSRAKVACGSANDPRCGYCNARRPGAGQSRPARIHV